jgi:hypothetical protein
METPLGSCPPGGLGEYASLHVLLVGPRLRRRGLLRASSRALGVPPFVIAAERGGHVDEAQTAAQVAVAPLRGELQDCEPSLPAASEDAEHGAWAAALPLDVDKLGGCGTPVIARRPETAQIRLGFDLTAPTGRVCAAGLSCRTSFPTLY